MPSSALSALSASASSRIPRTSIRSSGCCPIRSCAPSARRDVERPACAGVVSARRRPPTFAPFFVRSFRFQWPADLLTSWAFEMETLILSWYVMVQTGSVVLLTVFGALQLLGTLTAPMFGVLGDRLGARVMLCAMRAGYALAAVLVMGLALTHALTPRWVLVVAAVVGLVRPSDLVMR